MSDIVITGISGRFPQSDNVEEFKEHLLNKVYLVGDPENRVKFKFARQAQDYGLMRNLDKFDYQAFRVPSFIAKCCDPQGRILAEHVYEAIYDAGVSPKSLMGTKTGVYVGCFNYDSLEHWMFNKDTGLGMTSIGNTAYALSNRISYLLGVHGPSFTVDTACSSSMYALNLAFKDMASGECDSAIVAGSNLILNPFITKDFSKAGVLAMNGISRPFDKGSSGFVRSEACCVLFLQKVDKARRVYATVLNSKSNNDGFKIEGPTVPSTKIQKELFRKTYEELNMNPHDVDFIEAHATSTGIGDKGEITSIDEYFCKDRKKPLMVGSVKGNMGHSEGASGAVSVAKSILMFETGKILPNINIDELRGDCPGLIDGRIKVMREVEDFNGKIIGVNSFGVLGANAHSVIKRNEKVKINGGFPSDNMPRLLLWAGRHVNAVNHVFDHVASKPIDDEFLALLQCSQIESSVATLTRGFAIFKSNLDDRSTSCIDRQVKELDKANRPVVFVYSGVGSQWIEMGRDLIKIPLVAESINKCHEILMKKGLNLKEILTSNSPDIFKSCLNIFVGVVSIQIALTDLLYKIGVKPNFFIGHSVGELACAYADGTLTLEQTILVAYSRGMSIIEGVKIPGMMAAVAMNYKELKNILPHDIEIACHNSIESCTISGPIESVQKFVSEIKSKNVLAKIVDSSNVAFHSSLIANCGSIFADKLKNIIIDPKKRSSKWISTSINENSCDEYSSIDYHVNNMLSSVRFAEGLTKLPEDSLIIEIAPHGLLLPILKQSIPNGVSISLTQRGIEDGVIFLLQSLGKVYQSGVDLDIRQIYPKIDFPVSRGTPMISPLVKWLHDETFPVPMYDPFLRCDKRNLTINPNDPIYSIMKGHQLDDRVILPGTGYLYIVIETFAMMHGAPIDKFPVCIEDIKFMKSTVLDEAKEIDLTITIQRGSGEFEIVEKDEPICCGKIRRAEDNDYVYDTLEKNQSDEFFMDKKDFYKELRIRGYQYKGDFQLVQKVQNFTNSSKRFGEIEWTNSLISFIDCMVQTHITNTDSRELSLPISVRKVVVNFDKHNKMIENLESCKKIVDENGKEKIIFDIMIDDLMGVFRCGGIEVIKPEFHVVSRRKNINEPVLETYDFVSHFPTQILSAKNAAKFFVQLFIENSLAGKINIVEIDEDLEPLMTSMATAISEIPLITPTCYLLTKKSVEEIENVKVLDSNELSSVGRIDILMITGDDKINEFVNNINERGFLLIRNLKSIPTTPKNFKLIANLQLETENIFIFMKNSSSTFTGEIYEIPSTFGSFGWVEELKKLLETCEDLIIYSKDNFTGVLGFFKCLKKEFTEKTLRCFLIDDENAPNFDLTNSFFKNQLDLGLNVNIFKNGMWGSYRHLSFFQEIIEAPYSKHSFIHLFTKGDFSSISWVAGDLKTSDDNIIDIHYSSMNFRDVLVANQRISVDYEFENRTIFQYKIGFEFSGITRDGRRVAGVSGINGFSNAIKETAGNELTLINVPDSWSLEDAATFGTVYNTIYLAFFFRAKIEAGKSILIHAGSGALGQAAIHTAHSYGLKVYTTCGSKQKREFLLEEFPFLKDEDIGNSRDLSFEKMIMRRTNGRGVDYVLNSLSEDKMQASLRCVAENGTFLEVGKYDILVGNKIQLTHFLKEIKYVGIFLSNKFLKKNPDIKRDLNKKIEEDLRAGIIKPIRRTVFKANEIEKAFRYMASGKHIGKILLKIRESEDSKVTLPIQVKPRVFFDSEKVYIMPGGLGGMGMEIADWMIMRNCRKLVLSSSRGISNSYQSYRIRIWENYGTKVIISTANITTKEGCEELIKTANQLGEVGGIFNLAASLQDGLFQNLTVEQFEKSFKPKALSTKYLDEVSRKMCPYLEHFVVFSSVSCGRGNGGQTNYGLSNSITEKIIERRRVENLPGKVIQWGPISDVGMLENVEAAAFYGFTLQTISSCIDVLDKVLMRDEPIFSSLVCASKKKDLSKQTDLFSTLINALGIGEVNAIDQNQPLANLGLDSISGTEIQQVFERELGISISLKEIRSKSLKEIQELIQATDGKLKKPKDIARPMPTLNMNDIPFMPFE